VGLFLRKCGVPSIGKIRVKQVILLSAALSGDEVKILVMEVLGGDIKVVVVLAIIVLP
jgi:hypothetical protein